MTVDATSVRLRAIDLFERPVRLRLPFGFGAVTLNECSQAFVRVTAEIGGRVVHGATAELLLPKWFDKSPSLTNEQNAEQLRTALKVAKESYLAETDPHTVWTHSSEAGEASVGRLVSLGLPPLAAQYGRALIDKALADVVLRQASADWVQGVSAGILGDPYSTRLAWTKQPTVRVRHTVGLADLIAAPVSSEEMDAARQGSLEAVVRAQNTQYFKIKLSGKLERDLDRLTEIHGVLDSYAPASWRVTLDGNENFGSPDHLRDFWRSAMEHEVVSKILSRTLFLEQPLSRSVALKTPISNCGLHVPAIIDESGTSDEALEVALSLGYRGTSSKSCKGLFRSMHSAVVVATNHGLILSGEDLMCQAGLALQQDTLLASSLGALHIERNGHHFVGGFGTAPESEARSFARAHPDLYTSDESGVRVQIKEGEMHIASLHKPGFGGSVHPQWDSMPAMAI